VKKLTTTLTAVAIAVSSFGAFAAAKPAVVYDTAGKFDKSFNEAVYKNGVQKFNADKGIEVREFEPQNEAQREQGLRRLASRGFSPIVAVGFNMASAVEKVATEYPDIKFTIIDMVVDKPNVQSIVYKEHEGSFLVGALAAKTSKTNAVGFVGGMDIPLIRKFACGYKQGAFYADSDINFFENMAGSTPAAFADPAKGSELAQSQFSKGADVIFAAAGGTGLGVYQAAADAGNYAIGVDSNQNHIQPGTMLSSMVKKVGVSAYQSWEEAMNGEWEPGIKALGVKEGAIEWAYDEYNKPLVSEENKAYVESLKAKIVSGEIQVHDYMADSTCNI
jgi:basic membrane protein A